MKFPIRVGDIIASETATWEVCATKPGGVVELYDSGRHRSMSTYTRCIRGWVANGTHLFKSANFGINAVVESAQPKKEGDNAFQNK